MPLSACFKTSVPRAATRRHKSVSGKQRAPPPRRVNAQRAAGRPLLLLLLQRPPPNPFSPASSSPPPPCPFRSCAATGALRAEKKWGEMTTMRSGRAHCCQLNKSGDDEEHRPTTSRSPPPHGSAFVIMDMTRVYGPNGFSLGHRSVSLVASGRKADQN